MVEDDVIDLYCDELTINDEFLDVNVDNEGPRSESNEIRNSKGDHSDNMDVDAYGSSSHLSNLSPNDKQVIWKHQLFVGNLTWWTTDRDIADACHDIGVADFSVQDVKFLVDPRNGKSEGCCVISVASEASMRLCMELLPKKYLHLQKPMVMPLTEEFIRFENQDPPQMQPVCVGVPMWSQYELPIYQSQWIGPLNFSEQFVVEISEVEFEECMDRNRRVSSSAIARAAFDLVGGEYSSALGTLVTAISLIEPSIVAPDERCKFLISTLQDVLHEMQKFCNRGIQERFGRERSRRRSRSARPLRRSGSVRSHSRSRSVRSHSRSRSVRSHSRSRYPRCELKRLSSSIWRWERNRDRIGRISRHYSDKPYRQAGRHARRRSRSRESGTHIIIKIVDQRQHVNDPKEQMNVIVNDI